MSMEKLQPNRTEVVAKRILEIALHKSSAREKQLDLDVLQDWPEAVKEAIEEENKLSDMVAHEDQGRRLTYALKDLLNRRAAGEFAIKKISFGVYTTYNTPLENVTSSGGLFRELGKEEQATPRALFHQHPQENKPAKEELSQRPEENLLNRQGITKSLLQNQKKMPFQSIRPRTPYTSASPA